MKKITVIALLLAAALGAQARNGSGKPAYKDAGRPVEERVSDLLSRMTLEEKVAILHAQSKFSSAGVPRLGIPEVWCTDGPHGIRPEVLWDEWDQAGWTNDSCTAFPALTCLAATWNPEMSALYGKSIGEEARYREKDILLGPGVNIYRTPLNGRNFEYMGEDPYLSSRMVVPYIEEVQKNGVAACVKHFALYGASESGRDYNTMDMSRLRMYNEYLAPYKAAVDAGVGSIMSSFNIVDGIPATANKWLLTDLLRNEWGFGGLLVTDYNSIAEMSSHGVAPLKEASIRALQAGTDMDMVSCGFLNTLEESLKEKKITEKQINTACRRVLEAKYKLGLFSNPYKYCDALRAKEKLYTPEHRSAARAIAAETFVLLKNDNKLLPLEQKGRIALIGPMADARNNMCGMWSMTCTPSRHRTLLEGIRAAAGDKAEILYAKGSNIYYDAETEKAATGIRPLERGDNRELLDEALRVASRSDIIVAALGECAEMSGESASRTSLEIPDAQQDLLKALVKTGKPVVLLLFTGRPLVLNWEDANVHSILNVWFGGSETGDAVADVLFGKVTPSGKLTTTFPRSVGQLPLFYNHLNTGRPDPDNRVFNRYASNYLDESNEPLYPFGFGLSYTDFVYGDLQISSETLPKNGELTASVTVTNKGNYDGYETVQLYLRDIYAEVARPVKELKDFTRVLLKAGESQVVNFKITPDKLAFYDKKMKKIVEPGEFIVMVGASSDDKDLLKDSFFVK